MSRRSSRLLLSGYYSDDKEDDSKRNISYHESPVGRSSYYTVEPFTVKGYPVVPSFSHFRTHAPAMSSVPARSPASLSTGYFSKEEDVLLATRKTNKLRSHNRSPCFIGMPAGVLWFLMDVLKLGRKPVLMAVGLTFGLAMAFVCSLMEPTQAPPFTTTQFDEQSAGIAEIKMLHDEIFSYMVQRENKWKDTWAREWESAQRETAFLKEDRLKQKHMTEMLKRELSDLKSSLTSGDRLWVEQQIAEADRQISELKAELSLWLKQHLALVIGSQGPVHNAELQRTLKDLAKRLKERSREETAEQLEELWKMVRVRTGALTEQDVADIVQRALSLFRADGVGMADFALESLGSRVIRSRCSDSYQTKSKYLSLFGVPPFYPSESPHTIIQPEVYAGKCWAFRGDQGFATISLAYPVLIKHVTLEHLPKELSPTGHIYSAPKEFSVYGMRHSEKEGKLLGTFLYDYDGEPIQTFEIPESVRDVYSVVQLRVKSNWGHPEYTCIYRFRVHGQLWPA